MAKYRIIVSNDSNERLYYLLIKRWFGWKTVCGYHRGAPGDYAYQMQTAGNPWFLIEHTIPEVEQERHFPVLPWTRKFKMWIQCYKGTLTADGEVDVQKATAILFNHFNEHGKSTRPGKYPYRESIPWLWNKE